MNFFHDKLQAIPADEGGQVSFGSTVAWSGPLASLIPSGANAMMIGVTRASGWTFSRPQDDIPITLFDLSSDISQPFQWVYGIENMQNFQTYRHIVTIQFFKNG